MSNTLNIHIKGNKEIFLSKNAIKRFKNDLKKLSDYNKKLESSKYFKDGYSYDLDVNDIGLIINLIESKESINKKKREVNKKKLREKLRNLRQTRDPRTMSEVRKLRKEIPKDVLKSFTDLDRTFDVNVPKPDEILKNPEKFKKIIQAYASRMELSKDDNMNRKLNKYFKSLAKMLKLDVNEGDFSVDQIQELLKHNKTKVKGMDDDTDSD